MMNFTYENQGHITYLTYEISPEDMVDTMSLGMITNNKIAGLASCIFTQMDTNRYIKYNVSSKISVQQFFSGATSKKHLLNIFEGIATAILNSEDYMIDLKSIVLDLDYIFTDVSNCEVSLICLPIQKNDNIAINLNAFFKNIMFTTQFDQTENCDYVAKIINYLNAAPTISLVDFKELLLSLKNDGEYKQSETISKAESVETTDNFNTQKTIQVTQSVPVTPVIKPSAQVNVSSIAQPVVKVPITKTETTKSTIGVSSAEQKHVTDQNPKNEQQKKKSGLFGLFSKSSDKKVKDSNSKQVNMPIKQTNSSFAIPGQKVPVNSGNSSISNQNLNKTIEPKKVQPPVATPAPAPAPAPAPTPTYQPPVIPQGQAMNFGETTVLGVSNIGETTVLGAASVAVQEEPHLIRIKNNEKIALNKPVFRIGKEKSYVDYFIGDNTAISRSHANFISRDGQYFVTDTNSTNHTYINGGMIQSNVETKLTHGDKVRLANEEFEFKLY